MYAVPANRNGKRVPFDPANCMECGDKLFFSHDVVEGNVTYRYTSCKNLHTIFFANPTKTTTPLDMDQPGFLIDDTAPGWREQIPEWARWEQEKVADPPPPPRSDDVLCPGVVTPQGQHSDAPYCMQCGVQMQRAGTGHACPSCGSTSGFD